MENVRYYLSREFGLNLRWRGRDRDEIRRFNKKLWDGFRRQYFKAHEEEIRRRFFEDGRILKLLGPKNFSNAYIPGFLDSIEFLHFNHGYSFTDIGVDFGLTGQTIKKYFDRHDLKTREEKGAMYRNWDGEENRYVAILGEKFGAVLRKKRRKRREEELGKKYEIERERHVKAMQDFQEEHGEFPNVGELSEILGYAPHRFGGNTSIDRYWGHYSYDGEEDVTSIEAIDRLYRAAGASERLGKGRKMRSLV